MRRYEIFLPLRFNDGRLVPDDLAGEVLIAIRERFGQSLSRPKRFAASGSMKGKPTATIW